MGEILNFGELNFRGVKNFVVEATHENLLPRKFCHLDSLLNGKMAAEFRKKLCMHGHHVNNDIWEAGVGEMLVCMRELRNAHDRYAVVIEKDGMVISHLL